MMRLVPSRAAPGLALLALAVAAPLAAQSVLVHSTTTGRYVQLRPILYNADSARYEPQSVQAATPLTQDLEVNAWGFGVDGMRAYGLVRLRGSLGSDLVWPRYGDHFDALALYLEYEHANYALRFGRQQKASALGWYGFDGLAGSWHPLPQVRVEAYGGRGLARGYLEPYNSKALAALDPLRPDHGTWLLGAQVYGRPSPATSFSAIYQREILADRSGIVSERAALDGSATVRSFLTLTGSAEFDLATNTWGKARASATVLFARNASVRAEVFRYKPTLDLTTIWGVFGPQSHTGFSGTLQVAPLRMLSAYGSFTERQYKADTVASPFATVLAERSQEVAAGLKVALGSLRLDGRYSLNLDYGGVQSGGDVGLSLAPPAGWRVGLRGTAFQTDGEFRVADGTVWGAGVEASVRVLDRFTVRADAMRYMYEKQKRVPATLTGLDWNQTRATVSVDWTFGTNPDRQGAPR